MENYALYMAMGIIISLDRLLSWILFSWDGKADRSTCFSPFKREIGQINLDGWI
jgi:hypothetical protein